MVCVSRIPLVEIFQRHSVPAVVDYMSLDVEGAASHIMSSFPFQEYYVKALTVERPKENLQHWLRSNNYTFLQEMGSFGEQLWAHTTMLSSLDLKSIGIELPK